MVKLKAPDRCGDCSYRMHHNLLYDDLCKIELYKADGMPTDKVTPIDISNVIVTKDKRPEWCPMLRFQDMINDLGIKDKAQAASIIQGYLLLFGVSGERPIFVFEGAGDK